MCTHFQFHYNLESDLPPRQFCTLPLSICCTRKTVPEKKRSCFILTCTNKTYSQEEVSTFSLPLGLSSLTAHKTLKKPTNLLTAKRHQSPNTISFRKTKQYFQTTASLQESVFLGAGFQKGGLACMRDQRKKKRRNMK